VLDLGWSGRPVLVGPISIYISWYYYLAVSVVTSYELKPWAGDLLFTVYSL